MGIQGVAFNKTKSEIKEAIKAHKGVVSSIIAALDVGHTKFYEILKEDPEIKEELTKARNSFDELLLDMSEHALVTALKKPSEDLGNALGAARYVLNNKGKTRGYNPLYPEDPRLAAKEKEQDTTMKMAELIAEIQKLKAELNALKPEASPIDSGSDQAL